MSNPKLLKNIKLQMRAEHLTSPVLLAAPSPQTRASSTRPPLPKPTAADLTFERYKAASPNIDEQYDFIGRLREELPIIERDELDSDLLKDLAKQLELCIFPTCKMMHIDPLAVKRMLDDQFRNAYGVEVEGEVLGKMGLGRVYEGVGTGVSEDGREGGGHVEGEDTLVEGTGPTSAGSATVQRSNKKAKIMSEAQKEVKAYCARKKRGRRPCRIVTLRSKAASDRWKALTEGYEGRTTAV